MQAPVPENLRSLLRSQALPLNQTPHALCPMCVHGAVDPVGVQAECTMGYARCGCGKSQVQIASTVPCFSTPGLVRSKFACNLSSSGNFPFSVQKVFLVPALLPLGGTPLSSSRVLEAPAGTCRCGQGVAHQCTDGWRRPRTPSQCRGTRQLAAGLARRGEALPLRPTTRGTSPWSQRRLQRARPWHQRPPTAAESTPSWWSSSRRARRRVRAKTQPLHRTRGGAGRAESTPSWWSSS